MTVIGWAWGIIGGLMCFSAAMALFASVMIGEMAEDDPVPFIVKIFPLLAVVQIGIGVLGLIAGINFLKLEARARNVLECLSWLLLIFVLGFMVFWLSMTSFHEPRGFAIMGAVMGVVITGVYAVPLGVMLKYLRGPKAYAGLFL